MIDSHQSLKKKQLFFVSFSLILLIFSLVNEFRNLKKFNKNDILGKTLTKSIETTVFIGSNRFTLYGYTSPNALVTLSGIGIYDQTYANNDGYFIFTNSFSPLSPNEPCLTAQDQLGRITMPVCLPKFPIDYQVTIGPVIMPPTLSLDKDEYWVGDQVILSGQTIPNEKVNLSMFAESSGKLIDSPSILDRVIKAKKNKLNIFSFVLNLVPTKSANAFSLPKVEINADQKGNFSLVLPSSSANQYRVFTQVNFRDNQSPKSVKLSVRVLPWWMMVLKFFALLISIIKSRLLEISILLEFFVLMFFLYHQFFHPYKISRSRAIIIREKMALLKLN